MEHAAFLTRTYIEKNDSILGNFVSFSDVKIRDLKDSQKENVCKNVGCGEGREIYV